MQTRLQTGHGGGRSSSGITGVVSDIVATEGLGALYKGMMPALVLTTNPAIQFMVFDKLKKWWRSVKRKRRADDDTAAASAAVELTAFEAFVIGAMWACAIRVRKPFPLLTSARPERKLWRR